MNYKPSLADCLLVSAAVIIMALIALTAAATRVTDEEIERMQDELSARYSQMQLRGESEGEYI